MLSHLSPDFLGEEARILDRMLPPTPSTTVRVQRDSTVEAEGKENALARRS
jgi:hypothetical protein